MMLKFKDYLSEGGAYGHLANVWDSNKNKQELINLINNSLDLKFDYPEIKTDAINLMFSYKNGRVIAARNKSHLKNFGEKAMGISEIASKFAGRDIGVAYEKAMEDLQAGFDKLSDKQKEKIFDNGKHWMSIEVIGHGGKNIIDYGGISELRLHGTLEIDETGEIISQINKEAARMLDGMLRQREVSNQKSFTIKKLTAAQFKPIKNVEKHKKQLISDLKNVMGREKDLESYKINKLKEKIPTKDKKLIDMLIGRWVYGDKKTKITAIYKEYPNEKSWIQSMDKNIGNEIKDIMLPIEKIFLKLGNIVIGALNVFMTLNKENTVSDLRKKLDGAIQMIQSKGDEKMKAKLKLELDRIEAAGGINRIHPEEGVTFFLGDEFVKLTGAFAPLNQIIGLTFRL